MQKHLQKVQLQTFSNSECSSRHQSQIHKTTLCAGVPEGGKGQCSGDSGGPLLVNGEQVGIVSWSRKPCTVAPYPGVFTDVSAYVDWILRTIYSASQSEPSEAVEDSLEEILTGDLIIVTKQDPLNELKNKMQKMQQNL